MRKFSLGILSFIPLILIIVIINYFVDPANLFKTGYEEGIASYLASGMNVENIQNYDERLLQKYYIELVEQPADVIVLGSSRSMQVSREILDSDNLFNHCVSAAILNDMLAIYGVYKHKDISFEKVIIGVDPWIFNHNYSGNSWKSLEYFYDELMKEILNVEPTKSKFSLRSNKYWQLLSISYFQASIKNIYVLWKYKRVEYFPTDKEESIGAIKLADGSIAYAEIQRKKPESVVTAEVETSIQQNQLWWFDNYQQIDEYNSELFKRFLELLSRDNNQIVLLLPPYHPYLYQYMVTSDKSDILLGVEDFIRELGQEMKIQVIGSYNPADYDLDASMFYDGIHPKPEALRIIFQEKEL